MKSRLLCITRHQECSLRLSEILHALPFVVEHAATLQHARALLELNKYDAIVTEVALTDGTWLDVLHLVRESPDELRVIVTDERADNHFRAEAMNFGAYDVLSKPLSEPEVRRILCNACTGATSKLAAGSF